MKWSRLPSALLLLTILPAAGLLVIGLRAWNAAEDRAVIEARDISHTLVQALSGRATALLREADLTADAVRTDGPPADSPISAVFVASPGGEILLPRLIRFPGTGPLEEEDAESARRFIKVVDDTDDPITAALFLESGVADFAGTDLPGYLLYAAAQKYRSADRLDRARILLTDVVSTFPGSRSPDGRTVGPLAQLALIDVQIKLGDGSAARAEIRRLAERLADHAYDLPAVERDVLLQRAGELFAAGVLPEDIAERAALVDSLRSRVVPGAVADLSAPGADRWHHIVLLSRTGTAVFGWKSLELDHRPHVFGYRLSREWLAAALQGEAEDLARRHRATVNIGLVPAQSVSHQDSTDTIVERRPLTGAFRDIDVEVRLAAPGGLGVLRVLYIAMSTGLAASLLLGLLLSVKAVRKEIEAARLRQDFIDNVSHELRTPLTSIRMYAEMLAEEEGLPEEKRAEYLNWILGESERLSLLVDDVLDFARISRAVSPMDRVAADPAEIVEKALALARPIAGQQGFELTVALPPGTPRVLADPSSATRALLNLIINAVRHGAAGGSARIGLQVEDERIRITVTDRGPGICEEVRERLFDRFYRAPGGAPGGVGIGLVLAREIARAQGGDILLEETGPAGSRFALVLARTGEAGEETA